MMFDLVETEPGVDVPVQAAQDQILCLLGDVDIVVPDQISGDDLIILLKWNISTQHVVQKNTKTPCCQTVTCKRIKLLKRFFFKFLFLHLYIVCRGAILVEHTPVFLHTRCRHCYGTNCYCQSQSTLLLRSPGQLKCFHPDTEKIISLLL